MNERNNQSTVVWQLTREITIPLFTVLATTSERETDTVFLKKASNSPTSTHDNSTDDTHTDDTQQ